MKAWERLYASEGAARQAVLEQAMSWLDTRWAHAHALKGIAVDCAQLLLRAFSDAGLIPAFEPEPYAMQWCLHRDEPRFIQVLERYGRPVVHAQPADVAMYRFGRHAAHGALVVNDETILHASRDAGRVMLEPRRALAERLAGYWSVFS